MGSNIKIIVKSDKDMEKIGFFKTSDTNWHLCRELGYNVTFNLNTELGNIEIIDEDFGQPYEYKYIRNHISKEIEKKIEEIMNNLVDIGVVQNWKPGDEV